MKSMTGFGSAELQDKEYGVNFSVEVFTVNRKQLEIRPVLPKEFSFYEPILRKIISSRISRGSVTVKVSVDCLNSYVLAGKMVKVNEQLASVLLKKIGKMQSRLELSGHLEVKDIINVPGIIEINIPDVNIPKLETPFLKVLNQAVSRLITMREEEGANLQRDLAKRIQILKENLEQIKPFAESVPEMQKVRMLGRLKDADLEIRPDDERVMKEIMIYCDKADVTEEITRLESHFEQFSGFLQEDTKPVGRSLEFLVQEIFREITTLGNKVQSSDISRLVVMFKTELEKIREQVQNIE